MENPFLQIAESFTTPLQETAERLVASGNKNEPIEDTDFFLTKEREENQTVVGTFNFNEEVFLVVIQEEKK